MKPEVITRLEQALSTAPTRQELRSSNRLPDKIVCDIPGDGIFSISATLIVENTNENIQELLKQIIGN